MRCDVHACPHPLLYLGSSNDHVAKSHQNLPRLYMGSHLNISKRTSSCLSVTICVLRQSSKISIWFHPFISIARALHRFCQGSVTWALLHDIVDQLVTLLKIGMHCRMWFGAMHQVWYNTSHITLFPSFF